MSSENFATPLTPAGALTHGVSFTQGGSHTRAVSRAHVVSSPCGAPFTHGVPGSTHAGTLVTTLLAHGGSFTLGVSSTHEGALITTLGVSLGVAHGVSLILGGSLTHGLSLSHGSTLTHEGSGTHGVAFACEGAFAHALTLPVCVHRSTHSNTLVNTHRDTTHNGTTLVTTHTGTLITTLEILATTRAPGVFTPPKLCVHPSAALLPSTSRGTTEFTWS